MKCPICRQDIDSAILDVDRSILLRIEHILWHIALEDKSVVVAQKRPKSAGR